MDFVERSIANLLGGSAEASPEDMQEKLNTQTLKFLQDCFVDIPSPVTDFHTHIFGNGSSNSGCSVHEYLLRPYTHPYYHTKYLTILSGAGVKNEKRADQEIIDRLVSLVSSNQRHYNWGKHFIFALDKWYNEAGQPEDKKTGGFIPNEYVLEISQRHPNLFNPVISVHPYRTDALEELNKYGRQGIKCVKWLAPSMGIDPSHDKCLPFYDVMKKHNMVLISHIGNEHTMDHPWTNQSYGNPLLLRKALDKRVKVIAAHFGSLGSNKAPESIIPASNFKLFMKLFDDANYKDVLFTDLASVTEPTRTGNGLSTMLDRTDLHDRIVYGSDYPLPAVRVTISTKWLVLKGFITEEERGHLNEVFRYNPCLFDFALKRALKSPNGNKFHPKVFTKNAALFADTQ